MTRVGRKISFAVICVVALSVIVLPSIFGLAAQVLFKDRMIASLTDWTGQPVQLGDEFSVRYFPRLSATVSDVRIGDPDAEGKVPLHIRQAVLQLSLIEALFGQARLSSVVMIEPAISIARMRSGSSGTAILKNLLDGWIGLPTTTGGSAPDYVELRGGRVIAGRGGEPVIDNVEGRISNLDPDLPLRLQGGAVWQNMPISGSIEIAPVRLPSRDKPIEVSGNIRTHLGEAAITGKLNLSERNWLEAFSGTFDFSSSHLQQASSWLGVDLPQMLPDAISMSGELDRLDGRIALMLRNIEMGDQTGSGSILIGSGDDPGLPFISATLAFQKLDLLAFLRRLEVVGDERRQPRLSVQAVEESSGNSAEENYLVDLRISAEEAVYGAISMNDLALSGRLGGSDDTLEINDARLLGGSLQGSWRMGRIGNPDDEGRLDIFLRGVSGASLAEVFDIPGIVPSGSADIDLSLTGERSLSRLAMSGAGSFETRFKAGRFTQMDLSPVVESELSDGFFSLSRLAGSSLDYESAFFSGTLQDGIANLAEGRIQTGRYTIELSGRIPYVSSSLALSGSLLATPAPSLGGNIPENAEPQVLTRFFVGGSFSDPFVTARRSR